MRQFLVLRSTFSFVHWPSGLLPSCKGHLGCSFSLATYYSSASMSISLRQEHKGEASTCDSVAPLSRVIEKEIIAAYVELAESLHSKVFFCSLFFLSQSLSLSLCLCVSVTDIFLYLSPPSSLLLVSLMSSRESRDVLPAYPPFSCHIISNYCTATVRR